MEAFTIAEKYVPKEELVKVAECVLLSQDIREESWDNESKKYFKDDSISAKEAVNKLNLDTFWVSIIHSWNVFMWNDAQNWAESIIHAYK